MNGSVECKGQYQERMNKALSYNTIVIIIIITCYYYCNYISQHVISRSQLEDQGYSRRWLFCSIRKRGKVLKSLVFYIGLKLGTRIVT